MIKNSKTNMNNGINSKLRMIENNDNSSTDSMKLINHKLRDQPDECQETTAKN